MFKNKVIVTEQVSRYHPDKYADQISDRVVGYILGVDPNAKVAVETLVKGTNVYVVGEVTSTIDNDFIIGPITSIVNIVADELRYSVKNIHVNVVPQSVEINQSVVKGNNDIGAGDQGFMYGYATTESPDYIPFGHFIANKIINEIEHYVSHASPVFKGDAKVQVITEYIDHTPKIKEILISVQHSEFYSIEHVRRDVRAILEVLLNFHNIDYKDIKFIINPSGVWTVGGPIADAGLTGRKIVADAYGGGIPVGGGAFSGKDLTKVDRSAAYIARLEALRIVKDYNYKNVLIHVGYSIGISTPLVISGIANGGIDITHLINPDRFKVQNMVKELKDFKPYLLSQGCHFRGLLLNNLWETVK